MASWVHLITDLDAMHDGIVFSMKNAFNAALEFGPMKSVLIKDNHGFTILVVCLPFK